MMMIWRPVPKEWGVHIVEVIGDASPLAMTDPSQGPAKNIRIVETMEEAQVRDFDVGAIRIAINKELHSIDNE